MFRQALSLFMTCGFILIAAQDYIDITCYPDTKILRCPRGKFIQIEYVNYGRVPNSRHCTARGSTPSCYETGLSRHKVTELCQGTNSCAVSVLTSVFGDPCRGVSKYLEVHYHCTPTPARIENICYPNQKTLTCGDDTIIEIGYVNYGRTSRDVCPQSGSDSTTNCIQDTSSRAKVARLCNGKTTCTVSVTTAIFGDPCLGTYKYLEVHYKCVPRPITDDCVIDNDYPFGPCKDGTKARVYVCTTRISRVQRFVREEVSC